MIVKKILMSKEVVKVIFDLLEECGVIVLDIVEIVYDL